MQHLVGYTKNNIAVYVDLIRSEAAKHISRRPHLLGLAEEALQQLTCHEADIAIEHDMGRVIGYNFVVNTNDTDNIFYAQLVRETIYTRFTRNGKPLSTQYLTLVLHRSEDGATYHLDDAWIGQLTPPRPGCPEETAESRPYWETHAFILEDQPLQLRTVTKLRPY